MVLVLFKTGDATLEVVPKNIKESIKPVYSLGIFLLKNFFGTRENRVYRQSILD